ncbi:MAG: competence/damage-inducible protein A [Vicingaceae bacterium]|nr:competence/damage-inducible protein A [Vicingaceae bacterium]
MKLDILTIGDELLIGQTLNTNAQWIAVEMTRIGFEVRQQLTISDDEQIIFDSVDEALKNSDVVLITGGLGPTKDDLTLPVLNKFFGGELIENKEVYKDIERLILSRGFKMNQNNKNQALVSSACTPLRNEHGTAPGLWFEKEGKVVVAMPGVPYEMKAMLSDTVIPQLKEVYELPEIIHHMVYTQGLPESMLAELLEDWENSLPATIKLAYLPSPGRVKLRLSSIGLDRNKLQQDINFKVEELKKIIPDNIYSENEEDIQRVIGDLLRSKKLTVSTAESCTGGYIAHLITEIAGSSDYYLGSILSYANEVKINQLGVNADDIKKYGAVSQQVVKQMALGVKNNLKTDYALATSGIAGPTGGSDAKPVGTVWIAVATPNGVISEKFVFGKQRDINIQRASIAALGMLRREIK